MTTDNVKIIKRSNNIIIHIVIVLFSLFVTLALTGVEIARNIDYQKHKDANFAEVDATIVEYKEFKSNNVPYYVTYFKYISPNGETYQGFWDNEIYTENEARSMIGTKVQIYYDGEFGVRKSINEVNEINEFPAPDYIPGVVVIVVCFALFLNSLVRFAMQVRWYKKYKNI